MTTQNKHPFDEQDAYDQVLQPYGYHHDQSFQFKTPGLNSEYPNLSFGGRGQPHASYLPLHHDVFPYIEPNGSYAPRQEINTAFSSVAHQTLPIRPSIFQNAPSQPQPIQRPPPLLQPQQIQPMQQVEQPNIADCFAPPPYEDDGTKDRRDSIFIKDDNGSPEARQVSVGRRRKSEYAEPGSARAIYLEKNRKAASKCRNKQKQQQDQLVRRAREEERRNRALKNEIEVLRQEVQRIKSHIVVHANCQDRRITAYLEREADCTAFGHF